MSETFQFQCLWRIQSGQFFSTASSSRSCAWCHGRVGNIPHKQVCSPPKKRYFYFVTSRKHKMKRNDEPSVLVKTLHFITPRDKWSQQHIVVTQTSCRWGVFKSGCPPLCPLKEKNERFVSLMSPSLSRKSTITLMFFRATRSLCTGWTKEQRKSQQRPQLVLIRHVNGWRGDRRATGGDMQARRCWKTLVVLKPPHMIKGLF